jgi:hypothetical protein
MPADPSYEPLQDVYQGHILHLSNDRILILGKRDVPTGAILLIAPRITARYNPS